MTAIRQEWRLYIFLFSVDENGERICWQWRKWKEWKEEVVVVFAMAMTMAMLTMTGTLSTTAMIIYCLLLKSNGMIEAILYFLLIFNENARKNLMATKVMWGGRGKVGWFFVMSMVTVTAMATTRIAMIDCHSFYDSNGTIAAIIFFIFPFIFNENSPEDLWATKGIGGERGIWGWLLSWGWWRWLQWQRRLFEGKGGWTRGGEGEWKDGFVSINFLHFWHTKLSLQKWTEAEGRKEENVVWIYYMGILFFGLKYFFMLSYFVIVSVVSPFSMQVNWFHIKFESIVGWLSLARYFFQSKFVHHISVWQHSVRVN
jgi:hypothetical protein